MNTYVDVVSSSYRSMSNNYPTPITVRVPLLYQQEFFLLISQDTIAFEHILPSMHCRGQKYRKAPSLLSYRRIRRRLGVLHISDEGAIFQTYPQILLDPLNPNMPMSRGSNNILYPPRTYQECDTTLPSVSMVCSLQAIFQRSLSILQNNDCCA